MGGQENGKKQQQKKSKVLTSEEKYSMGDSIDIGIVTRNSSNKKGSNSNNKNELLHDDILSSSSANTVTMTNGCGDEYCVQENGSNDWLNGMEKDEEEDGDMSDEFCHLHNNIGVNNNHQKKGDGNRKQSENGSVDNNNGGICRKSRLRKRQRQNENSGGATTTTFEWNNGSNGYKKMHHNNNNGTAGIYNDEDDEDEDASEDCLDEMNKENAEDFGLHVFNSCPNPNLLRLTDMPAHLQFNKFVHTGYRRLHNFWGCFWSLFYFHNETVNIVTHVIPIVWVLTYWRSMYPWEDIQGNTFFNILGWSHVISSISPWLGSVIYHLFMNHERGASFYHFLLQMDMFGIWVTECFGALTNLSASTWCLPGNLQTIIILLYSVSSIWGLQKAMTAWTPLGRRMCFAPVFITRLLGFFLRISSYGGGEPDVLLHVILQDAVSLVGGMIGVIRVPEKWFPGKLDFFCNSHHIMHVLVVLAVFHMNIATNGDVRWMLRNINGCPA